MLFPPTVGATTPPTISDANSEPGLMTWPEYVQHLNPTAIRHRSDAYDLDISALNERRIRHLVGQALTIPVSQRTVLIHASTSGLIFFTDGRPVAVLIDGTLYHDEQGAHIIDEYRALPQYESRTSLNIHQRVRVKYVAEYVGLADDLARYNTQKYPVVLRRFVSAGEPMTVRASEPPIINQGTALAVVDSHGRVVAVAQDEWGTTLIAVAREARGRHLGKLLADVWHNLNPEYLSGGMTLAGEAMMRAVWIDRVREFLARGWYSALIRLGQLTSQRLGAILADLPPRPRRETAAVPANRPSAMPLVMSDGRSFVVVYDRALLNDPAAFDRDPDDRFIYGYALLRSSPPVGAFVYTIDYDRPFADLTTRAILQLARDNGARLYDGEGYHDLLEGIDAFPEVHRQGEYLVVTRDLLPLRDFAAYERLVRRPVDPYGEFEALILAQADTKWR